MSSNQKERNTKTNQSAEKVMTIIEALASAGGPIKLFDLAKVLHMNVSTLFRFLATLEDTGYISQDDETQKYYLTYKILTVANKIQVKNGIREMAKPYMLRLSEIFNEAVCLGVEQNKSVVYIDVLDNPRGMIGSMQRIGSNAPMHCTGMGKLLLLNYTDAQIDEMIAAKGLPVFTENTIDTKEKLLKELELTSKIGYAFDNEECEFGAKCLAAPVRDYTGKVIAAISVTGPIFRMGEDDLAGKIPYLLETTRKLSIKMGFTSAI